MDILVRWIIMLVEFILVWCIIESKIEKYNERKFSRLWRNCMLNNKIPTKEYNKNIDIFKIKLFLYCFLEFIILWGITFIVYWFLDILSTTAMFTVFPLAVIWFSIVEYNYIKKYSYTSHLKQEINKNKEGEK